MVALETAACCVPEQRASLSCATLIILAGWLIACGDEGPPPSGGCALDAGTCVPKEVDAILEAKCRQCHGSPPTMFAPMSLVSLEDFEARHAGSDEPNYVRMRLRINDPRTPMPPITFPQLTEDERATLNRWVDAGLPAGPP